MRYKYLTIILMFSALFSQDKISLENVLDGTFRTESIGRYDWKNSSDSYYFSKRSDDGLEFYEYNLASNDTLKAFTVKKNIITKSEHNNFFQGFRMLYWQHNPSTMRSVDPFQESEFHFVGFDHLDCSLQRDQACSIQDYIHSYNVLLLLLVFLLVLS